MIGIGVSIWGQRASAVSRLARRISGLIPTGITTLIVGDDLPNVSTVASLPARIGVTATPVGTARASLGSVNGRRTAIWAADAAAMGYSVATGQKSVIAVAAWTGPANFPAYVGLVGGQVAGANLRGQSGTSNILVDATIYRDGVTGAPAVDSPNLHIWESVAVTPTANTRQVGCSDSAAVNNWRGPIAFCMQLSVELSAGQRSALVALLKTYYSIP